MRDEIVDFVLRGVAFVGSNWDWFSRKANKIAINLLVNKQRNRPHPWSTRYDYISWSGLTDRTYNARLLPKTPYRDPPDAATVAALFAMVGEKQRVCPKSTCLFPAFAQYLTDGFIRTAINNDDPKTDRHRTTSNHDIDMSPLYGRTETQTGILRRGSGGLLKSQMIESEEFPPYLYLRDGETLNPDMFGEDGKPVLDEPLGISKTNATTRRTLFAVGGDRANGSPQAAMLNTLFLREHNRLAGEISRANPSWDDEELFQKTRNNIIVLFIKIVVEEYINHINPTPLKLRADPEAAWSANWNRPNWITAEFSLLYRWHSLVPDTFHWNGQNIPGMAMILNNELVIRDGLASAFAEISDNRATELGLRNTATSLMAIGIEQRAIEQARSNNLATYNDYRIANGKKRATSFKDITRDQTLESLLKSVYGTPDRVEFYVGLFAEPRERNSPLTGLILDMVAVDAFSQALTNPLLSEHIWGNEQNKLAAFTAKGLSNFDGTSSLRDILERNSSGLNGRFVGMTRRDWKRE